MEFKYLKKLTTVVWENFGMKKISSEAARNEN